MVYFVEKLSDLEQLRDIWAAGGKVVIQADEPAELPPSFDSAASSISTTTQQSCKRQRMQSVQPRVRVFQARILLQYCHFQYVVDQYNILYFVMYHCYHLESLLLKQVLVEQLMNDSLLRLWKTGGFFLNNVQPEDDDEVDIVSIYIYVVVHA